MIHSAVSQATASPRPTQIFHEVLDLTHYWFPRKSPSPTLSLVCDRPSFQTRRTTRVAFAGHAMPSQDLKPRRDSIPQMTWRAWTESLSREPSQELARLARDFSPPRCVECKSPSGILRGRAPNSENVTHNAVPYGRVSQAQTTAPLIQQAGVLEKKEIGKDASPHRGKARSSISGHSGRLQRLLHNPLRLPYRRCANTLHAG